MEHHQLPVVFSGSAVDTFGSTNPLSIGSVGIMGCTRAGNFALQNSDLLLVIGNRLTTMTTGEQLDKLLAVQNELLWILMKTNIKKMS